MSESSGSVTQSAEWGTFHQQRAATNYPKWPNEAMLKVLFGSYMAEPKRPQASWKVLDVGCGFGNNLVPFLDMGCDCHGIEIDPAIIDVTHGVLADRGWKATLGTGSNRSLPYADGTFDLLLSINTLHYEGSEENVLAALAEFRRVLKPGGTVYLSTVGPQHEIYRRAEVLGDHRFRIKDYDFRDGQEFFFFESEAYLKFYCCQFFGHVETGQVTERLMTMPIDFLVAACR